MNPSEKRPTRVHVFEVTMDNGEDQNELNRRLCKLGEPPFDAQAKPATTPAPAPASQDGMSS